MRRRAGWLLWWCAATVAGGWLLARLELAQLQSAFDTDARIVHRLLSQRMVQHDAVLETLALLQPAGGAGAAEQRLPSLYPQILSVRRRGPGEAWPDAALSAAESTSRQLRRAALGPADLAQGRYWLVLAAEPASFALQLSLRDATPLAEWPATASAITMTLSHAGQHFTLQPGGQTPGRWTFDATKVLASESQPFSLAASRNVTWTELPWWPMAAWGAAVAAVLAAGRALFRQREQRRRAEELLRLGQVGRLNALGELAAGLAHELNQPLTAVLASTQAAGRLLADDPPELETARTAMAQAAQQARRAAEVVGRLRRAIERPDTSRREPINLETRAREALHLLEPELRRRAIEAQLQPGPAPVIVRAEPVALEQIVHNLLMNALHALEQVPRGQRHLVLATGIEGNRGTLSVTDTGPGIAPHALERLFEPFFSTREGGLGLGLSLCETLAGELGGALAAANHPPRGARFVLSLPLAQAGAAAEPALAATA
ncbi:MAG: ATP-binding protein [Pseudomonadota bacterium]